VGPKVCLDVSEITLDRSDRKLFAVPTLTIFFIVAPCILITLKFLSPTNAPLYYTYKMLKYTVKISHHCSYMFRSTWTVIREPMPNLAKVTILCRYSVKIRHLMSNNVGKKCFCNQRIVVLCNINQ
jgi:hypothetical protein